MIQPNKRVDDLLPYLENRYNRLVEECKKVGLTLHLIETKRSQARQEELNDIGAGPRLIGPHGFGCAFDVAPIKSGKIDWNDYAAFKKMGAIGKSLGLQWGGDWKSVDCPHFEWVGGLTDAQLRAGRLPKFPEIPSGKEGFDIMQYDLQPIAKGMLKNTSTLTCCSKPSNASKTSSALRKGVNEPINIYAKTKNEGIEWYLVNKTNEQWVAAHYVQIK